MAMLRMIVWSLLCLVSWSVMAKGQANSPSMDVFGIRMNQPLALAECPKSNDGLYDDMATYNAPRSCWKHTEIGAPKGLPATGSVELEFTSNETAPFDGITAVNVNLLDGNVAGFDILTAGAEFQSDVYQALKEKYGAPLIDTERPVQTLMGAEFNAMTAIWAFDNLGVSFRGVVNDVTSGMVSIETKAWIDYEKSQQEAKQSKASAF